MSNQFTLQEFAAIMAEKLGTPKGKTYEATKEAFQAMGDHVTAGGRATISPIGIFSTAARKERVGRNPKTGEKIKIPAKKVVVFKASKTLRESANKATKKKAKK